MTREKSLELLKSNLSNQNLIKHSFAAEAIMRSLAERFKENKEKWGTAGLLHDIDYEKVKDNLSEHSLAGAKMLEEAGLDKDVCNAVKVHNEAHGIPPQTLMEKALFVTDPLTGLITASALVLPSKKLADVTAENVLNRFKQKGFAKGANREIIGKCETMLDLKLEEFVRIGLEAMKKISGELGL
jgi:putative nucleotidyltransferase with HDIG domain